MADCKVCGASVDEGKEYCDACKPSEEETKDEGTTEGGDTATEAPAEDSEKDGEKEEGGDTATEAPAEDSEKDGEKEEGGE